MKITFIGGGNMAGAMIGGLVSQGFAAQDLHVVDPDAGKREQLASQYQINVYAPDETRPASDVLIFAVKPQLLQQVAHTTLPQLHNALVISIAAGVRVDAIARWLGDYQRIVRVMPNTPALMQAGISGVYATEHVTAADRAATARILAAIGKVVWLDQESELDGITAISGSGPAYVFYFIEALQAAAQAQGFSPAIARELAYETVAGAMKLAAHSEEDAASLRVKVTSKGGTTERAINAMENSEVRAAIIAATQAAAARSRELGDEFGRDAAV